MNWLLETNIVTQLYDRAATGHLSILRHLARLPESDRVGLSILTLCELEYGWANAPDAHRPMVRKKIGQACQDFEIVPLSITTAHTFGGLKRGLGESEGLSKRGLQRHNVDLLLASTCLSEG